MKLLRTGLKVGVGVGVGNTAYEFAQNKYHLSAGNITPEEFRWRTFTSMSSNIPCPFVKMAISSEDLYNRVDAGELGVTDVICAISAQTPLDPAALVKAGGNLCAIANYMLESSNVIASGQKGNLTGNEMQVQMEALHASLAGSAGPTRKFSNRD